MAGGTDCEAVAQHGAAAPDLGRPLSECGIAKQEAGQQEQNAAHAPISCHADANGTAGWLDPGEHRLDELETGPETRHLSVMDTPARPPASPMMAAHAQASAAAPGYLVLYRVGEFYEILGSDAPIASRALGLQLTHRRQRDAPDVPMCGVPSASAAGAVARLLAAGHRVALSEQPVEAGGERPLRLMTPATSVDADVLVAGRANNLTVALAEGRAVAFAWIDLSTSEIGTCMASLEGCGPALARIGPSEILVAQWPEDSDALAVAIRSAGLRHGDLGRPSLTPEAVEAVLSEAFGPAGRTAMRGFSPPELRALAALLDHVRVVVGQLPAALPSPRRAATGDTMEIDAPTLRGLEVLDSASGAEGSLLAVLDRTVTAAGARLLRRQLCAPLTSIEVIGRRLAMVRYLVADVGLRRSCREGLSGMPDLLRACGRLSLGKGGPRDLAAVRDGLGCAAVLTARLDESSDLPPGLATARRELGAAEGVRRGVAAMLRRALIAAPPLSVTEPGFVAPLYDERLDRLRTEAEATKAAIEALQGRYAQETGIKTLKIRSNSVLGYHVEVPSAAARGLGSEFRLRQGLASTTRFSTTELDQLAGALEAATEQARSVEQAVFRSLASAVLGLREALMRVAHAAAALDLVCGLAQAAAESLWTEPELTTEGVLAIQGGRHPVSERLLEGQGRTFVQNDCVMGGGNRLWLLTGPNMAGKSTFLRQVAIVVLLAQIGSFVPASHARVGIVDKLFSRIGASDDLAAGRSTFMVEMLETAAIMNQATDRSLVILDEVGRGTSTHDGLAIAQACMEYLHDVVGCRTLFATHYHELADVAEAMEHGACMMMDAAAGRHKEMFAYKVKPGRAGQSYGLRVAARAGMPGGILERASELLAKHRERAAFRTDPTG
ncbi:DNA mismatch repair protein MutS [Roseomonas mucosa]